MSFPKTLVTLCMVCNGVKQGRVLSPSMFNIYIDKHSVGTCSLII